MGIRDGSAEYGSVTGLEAPVALPELRGVIPILVTPFRADGSTDLEQMGRQVDFLVGCGIRWAGFGFGSELPALDGDEALDLMRCTVSHAAGRLQIIGNAEMTSVRAGISAVRRSASTGVSMVMVRPSGFGEATQTAICDGLAEVTSASPVPCIVQDAPQSTGVQLSADTLARLLVEVPRVAAVKIEPSPSPPKVAAVVEALDGRAGTVLGGSGASQLLLELDRGASGTMPGPALPDLLAAVCRLHAAGRRADAAELFRDFLPLAVLAGGLPAFLFSQKYLLSRRGVLDEPRLRPPHGPIDPRLASDIEALLEAPVLRRTLAGEFLPDSAGQTPAAAP